MQISQLLKIHNPQTLHLSHAAKRKGYSFSFRHILSNFHKDLFCQPFTSLNELEWGKGDLYALILLSVSHFSLATPLRSSRRGDGVPVTRGQGFLTLWEQGFAWLGLACLTLSHLAARPQEETGGRSLDGLNFSTSFLPTCPSSSPEEMGSAD